MNLGWEPIWRKHGARWELQEPHPRVVELVQLLKKEGRSHSEGPELARVHDLGCGLGRHLLLLAAEGFDTYGSDISPTAVETCQRRLREAALSATVTRNEMTDIPQPNGFLDAVIAWNVLYHATTEGILRAVGGVRDKLNDGGYLLATFISTDDGQYARSRALLADGRATELEPDTFVIPGDTVLDKALPHHYSTEQEIRESFLDGLDVVWLEEERREAVDFEGHAYPSVHWQVLARKEGSHER